MVAMRGHGWWAYLALVVGLWGCASSGGSSGGGFTLPTGGDTAQCVPACEGKQCGDNGCGGTCGTCGDDKPVCSDGQCTAASSSSVCGNGTCETDETTQSCAADCPAPPTGHYCDSHCGSEQAPSGCYCDSVCAGYGDCCLPDGSLPSKSAPNPKCTGSTCALCTGGSAPQCGNGVCEAGETAASCAQDCKSGCTPKCPTGSCGDDGCGGACTCSGGASCVAGACVMDPCKGVPATGVCDAGGKSVQRCLTPTGNGTPKLDIQNCAPWEVCAVSPADGVADCVTKPGLCTPGTSTCSASSGKAEVCDDKGNASLVACPGCVATAVGAACQGVTPTTTLTGTLQYQAKGMNSGKNGWVAAPSPLTLSGALVMVLHSTGSDFVLVDAGTTGPKGEFAVKVPQSPSSEDMLLIMLAKVDPATQQVLYAVAKPDVPTGKQPSLTPPATSQFWSWPIPASAWADGQTWTIALDNNSGAVRVFDYLRYVFEQTAAVTAKQGKTVVVWLGYDTTWTCGACFSNDDPATVSGVPFQTQIYFPGSTISEEFWADAVTAHEMGHWVMASYGYPPGEGGKHALGKLSMPGMAWSEGWATGFSSMARGTGLYFDVQEVAGGAVAFWLDLDVPKYAPGFPDWNFMSEAGGLLQPMDENAVAGGLWLLADHAQPPLAQPSNSRFFAALASPRMTKAPFARGYTRHTWDLDANNDMINVVDLKKPAPMLADFMDALLCLPDPYVPAVFVGDAYSPYPYDPSAPLCK